MTITLYSWLIPLAVTVAAFVWALSQPNTDRFGIGNVVDQVLALILSLVAWLVWAVLT
jgi:hypothetical protein